MHEAWENLLQFGPGWYWMGHHLRGGDLYHACSLVTEFRKTHAARYPIFLALEHQSQASLASLFGEHFDEVVVARGFPNSLDGWRKFFDDTGLPTFGINSPLVVHPFFSLETTRFSVDFLDQNRHFGLTWMQLYKQILHLPGTAEPKHPVRKAHLSEQARQFCAENQLAAGSSVILCPYAQSLPVDALGHFAELGRVLTTRGYDVWTSVAGTEQPVAGTRAITIPFAILSDVAEHAGWIVAVRSGICDIVSSASCRKSFIYPDMRELRFWSVAALGFCRDAVEFPFDFASGSADRLISLVLGDEGFDRLPAIRQHLSGRIGDGMAGPPVTTLSFTRLQRRGARGGGLFPGEDASPERGPAVERLLDVPPRDHPRMAPLIDDLVAAYVAHKAVPETRFYACRDTFEPDTLEEIDRSLLLRGEYFSATRWHSIVAVRGVALKTLLPPDARDLVMSCVPIPVGQPIRLDEAFEERLALDDTGVRPFSYRGLQIANGWCALEPWGIWSEGLRSSLRFMLEQPPRSAVRVTIHFMACISEAFPELRFSILANGHSIGDIVVSLNAGMDMLAFDVPADLMPERTCVVTFAFAKVLSPEQQGGPPDGRLLGIGIHWLQVDLDVG